MNRKIKALGLALVAVVAMSAVMASAASASQFTAGKVGAALHGAQPANAPHIFTVTGQKVTCKVATFTGTTVALADSKQTITPEYKECEAFGLGAQVTMNGCDYLFTTAAGVNTVDIVCPTGKDITIDAPAAGTVCVVHIPPQNGINGIAFANNGTDIDTTAASTNITATVTKESFLCPAAAGEHSNATYSGTVTLKADGGATTISYDK